MPPVAGAIVAVGAALNTAALAAGAAFGFTAAQVFAAIGIFQQILVGVALSAISRMLAPRPKGIAVGGVKNQVQFGEDQPASAIMGLYATAGDLVYAGSYSEEGSDEPNEFFVRVIELADFPCRLARVLVNGEYVTLSATVDNDAMKRGRAATEYRHKGNDHLWIRFYDGTQTAADPGLRLAFGDDADRPWSEDMVGRGICYAIVTARYNPNIHRQLPQCLFELEGMRLYDPRHDTTAGGSGAQRWATPSTWSGFGSASNANPVVQIYNILRGLKDPVTAEVIWGPETPERDLPADVWFAAMNACDEEKPAHGGGTEAAYRAGIEISFTEDAEAADAIEELLKACQGVIAEVAGQWHISVGAPGASVYAFSDDDIVITAPEDFDPFPGLIDVFNGVNATYPEPGAGWEAKDARKLRSATYLAEDGGRLQVADLRFPTVPYRSQVQRLMKSALRDQRRFRRHALVLPPEARALGPLDVVSWTSLRNGYEDKQFTIDLVEDLANGCVAVALREVDPSDYDFDASDLQASDDGFLGRPVVLPLGTSFSVEPATVLDADGEGRRPAIRLMWNPEIRGKLGIRWQVRLDAHPEHVPDQGGTDQADDDLEGLGLEVFAGEPLEAFAGERLEVGYFPEVERGRTLITSGILANTAYQVRARYDRPGKDGPWSDWMEVTTPDTRLSGADLDDLLNDRITQALNAAEAAAADAETALGASSDALAQVATLAGDTIDELHDLLEALGDIDAGDLVAANLRSLQALKTGWNNDPTFQTWSTGPDAWTVAGLSAYATQFAGFYGSGLELDIAAGPIGGSVRASSETAGQLDAGDPTAPWVVLYALVTLPAGMSTSAFRIRPEWKIGGTWTRGDMKGLTAPVGSFAQLGIAATDSLQQGIEVLVQKPAGAATAVSVLLEKDSGVTSAAQVQLHLLGIRRASDAEIAAGQAAGNLAAAVATINSSIAGISSAMAAQNTTLTASINAVSSNLSANYYTRSAVDGAIAAASTSLGTTISGVSANLASNYYTRAATDAAIAASATSLSSTISGVSASLDSEAATRATADAALSGRITTLEARKDPASVVSGGSFATGIPTSGGPAGWSTWPSAFTIVAKGGSAPQATSPTAFMAKLAQSGANQSAFSERYEAKEGDRISTVAFLYAAGGTTRNVSLRVRIHWQSAAFTDLGTVVETGPDNYGSTAWARWQAPTPPASFAAAPAGTAYVQVELQRLAASSAGDGYITQIEVRKGDPVTVARLITTEATAASASAAIGSLTTEISAAFGSESAFISGMSAAVASLDLLASSYVLRQRAGAASGSLEAVAFSTPDGTALSSFKLDYDYIDLEGRVLARDLVIADSTNMVPDDQLQDAAGWGITASTTEWELVTSHTVSDANSIGQVKWINNPTATGSAVLTGRSFRVTEGDRLACSYQVRGVSSVYSGTDPPVYTGYAQLRFLDRDGATVSTVSIDLVSGQVGSAVTRSRGPAVVVVPSGAVYAAWRWVVSRAATNITSVRFYAPLVRRQSPAIEIADGAITAPKINVTDLGAISATLGTCTITSALNFAPGVVITGALGLNAVTEVAVGVRSSLLTISTDGTYVDVCSVTVSVPSDCSVILGAHVDWDRQAYYAMVPYGSSTASGVEPGWQTYRVLRGSAVVWEGDIRELSIDASSGTGSRSYKLQVQNNPPGNGFNVAVSRLQTARVAYGHMLVQFFKR